MQNGTENWGKLLWTLEKKEIQMKITFSMSADIELGSSGSEESSRGEKREKNLDWKVMKIQSFEKYHRFLEGIVHKRCRVSYAKKRSWQQQNASTRNKFYYKGIKTWKSAKTSRQRIKYKKENSRILANFFFLNWSLSNLNLLITFLSKEEKRQKHFLNQNFFILTT